MKRVILVVACVLLAAVTAHSQSNQVGWQRSAPPTGTKLTVFHSTHAVALPTATTLGRGIFQFEIAHRFFPAISEGRDALWGMDGPVIMRLGLAYAPADLMVVTVARSNQDDNLDLQLKYQLLRIKRDVLPLLVALQAGAAWNSEVFVHEDSDSRNFQYYGQAIINTRVGKRFAAGVVPSFLYNADIFSEDTENSFALGMYTQAYLSRIFSLVAEWAPVLSGRPAAFDPVAVGFELETGGHFFKIVVSSSVFLNPSQYLSGTEYSFEPDEWRLGFSITRILHF